MNIIKLVALLFISFYTNEPTECDTIYIYGEQLPEFIGGEIELLKYNTDKIIPILSLANKRSENLITKLNYSLTISKTGKVVHSTILTEVDQELEKELHSVLLEMPLWLPGKVKGKKECMQVTIPLSCIKWE